MSSFRKRVVKRPIPGTRTSPQTGQMITSSGNPSLDVILGGGLPIGSICLIEEDKFVTYSKVLAKYFMAEGVLSKQSIFLGSLDDTPKELIKKLPQHCTGTDENEENTEAAKNGLRIAWRYNDLPMVNSEQAPEKIGHNFNLMEFMDPELIQFAHTVTWSDDPLDNDIVVNKDEEEEDGWDLKDTANNFENENDAANAMDSSKEIELENSKKNATPNPALCLDDKQDAVEDKNAGSTETSASSSMPPPPSPLCKPPTEIQLFTNTKYFRLLKEVNNLLCDDKFHSGGFLVKRSLCRVCITSLGSPQWYDDNFGEDLVKFLTILRAAIRSSVSVCFITIPMHLVAKYDDTLVSKIRNLVDYSIELESFAGSDKETNPAFKEYNGLFQLRKMAAINTLSAYMPETTDLAFKLKRKKFVIEKLHLPPELQDDSTNEQDMKLTLSCGSNKSPNSNNSLDF